MNVKTRCDYCEHIIYDSAIKLELKETYYFCDCECLHDWVKEHTTIEGVDEDAD